MPMSPLHYCPGSPTCRVKVRSGYCPDHARHHERARGAKHERGYTYRWDVRAAAFKRRYPLCGMRPDGQAPVMSQCHDQGRTTAAYQVDHVVPHRGDPALFWDAHGNWQSLCASCGSRKSAAGL